MSRSVVVVCEATLEALGVTGSLTPSIGADFSVVVSEFEIGRASSII